MTDRHDAQTPSALLIEYRDRLPKGTALDVAMGYGRHALYLAEAGWTVHGIERDPDAVASCRAEAARRGVTIHIQQADLETLQLPVAAYDLITCFFYLDRALIPQLRAALRPGGVIMYETFSIEHRRRFGVPGRSEFCLQPDELTALFAGFSVMSAREGLVNGQYVSSLVATKPTTG